MEMGWGRGERFIFSVRYIRRIRYANGADIIAGVVTAATKDLFSSSADAFAAAVRDGGVVFHPRLHAVIGSVFKHDPRWRRAVTARASRQTTGGREKRGRGENCEGHGTGTFGNNNEPRLKVPYYAPQKKALYQCFPFVSV